MMRYGGHIVGLPARDGPVLLGNDGLCEKHFSGMLENRSNFFGWVGSTHHAAITASRSSVCRIAGPRSRSMPPIATQALAIPQ